MEETKICSSRDNKYLINAWMKDTEYVFIEHSRYIRDNVLINETWL